MPINTLLPATRSFEKLASFAQEMREIEDGDGLKFQISNDGINIALARSDSAYVDLSEHKGILQLLVSQLNDSHSLAIPCWLDAMDRELDQKREVAQKELKSIGLIK